MIINLNADAGKHKTQRVIVMDLIPVIRLKLDFIDSIEGVRLKRWN